VCVRTTLLLLTLSACEPGQLTTFGNPRVPPAPVDAGPPLASDAGESSDAGTRPLADECGDLRLTAAVYYGTSTPTYAPLTDGQVYAIGSFNGCSGLLIAPSYVLTARHCSVRVGSRFCVDTRAQDPSICFEAAEVWNAPNGSDMTLLRIDEDATARFPEVVPVPYLLEDLSSSWVGRTAEAAGFGQQEDGGFNEREFTAQPISGVGGEYLTIDGEGSRGVCFGDSGGPVFVVASDGAVRTAGVLTGGDSSCVGMDNYTRVDINREWLMSHVAPVDPPGAEDPCEGETAAGRCEGSTAVYCEGSVVREDCPHGCGDVGGEQRCLPMPPPSAPDAGPADPCGGLDETGVCVGNVARWCQDGWLHERDCGACGQVCAITGVGAYCR